MEMEFGIGGVPIRIAAKVYKKDPNWVRVNMQNGILPIGVVTTSGNRRNYYISPKLLYEHTGYVYKEVYNE